MPEAEGSYPVDFNSAHFSIKCNYTISNSQNFSFDDIIVRPLQVDITAPQVEELTILSDSSLLVTFSEAIDEEPAADPDNYLLNDNQHPANIVLDEVVRDKVTLTFDQVFENQVSYTLTISNIADGEGNVMPPADYTFTYLKPFPPGAFDVVIHELMADVNPEPNGLPAYDYVELFNTTDKLIDLSNCILSWGAQVKVIPEGEKIAPQGYLVLTDDDAEFPEQFPKLLYSSFPVNNEARMTLKTADYAAVHTINYDKSWYGDQEKEDGGWSLEMIDPQNPCGGIDNYGATENSAGGTPGAENAIHGPHPDTIAPQLSYARLLSDTSIILHFSETMDTLLMGNAENYTVTPPGASPANITLQGPDYRSVVMSFAEDFPEETTIYSVLTSGNLADCAGNTVSDNTFTFSNYYPEYGDLVISEIMADVNPEPPGLPPAEYVEIHNSTSFPEDISAFRLYSGNTEITLPEGLLVAPNSFFVIADNPLPLAGGVAAYYASKLSIRNDGEAIYLEDKSGDIMHHVSFDRSWYDDPAKEEGGWALEIIDINNVCGQSNNWRATKSASGGTPGEQNSIAASNPDNKNPDILRIAALAKNQIRVYFDEPMNHQTLTGINSLEVTPSGNQAGTISPVKPGYDAVDITFEEDLDPETTYQLNMTGDVEDCAGNRIMVSGTMSFTYPIKPDTGDVVINEILFNTSETNSDFIELYNTSGHAIDLSSLFILQKDPQTGLTDKKISITQEKLILIKEAFIALTGGASSLKNHYPDAPQRNILQVEGFPNYRSAEDVAAIENTEDAILDAFHYHEDMHFDLIDDSKDVSLERIDPYASAQNSGNWHSASEESGFATPGKKNSQHVEKGVSEDDIVVTPGIITPNNDGSDDVVSVAFQLGKPGYGVNITIFDAHGRKVLPLVNNYLPGTSGRIFWDGTDENSRVVPSGYYILMVEIFDLKGNKQHFKKTVVVSGGR
jgi:hypothetical protein